MIPKKINGSPNSPNGSPKRIELPLEVQPAKPSILRFSPTAWAKLLYLRDAGQSEVGGFGISAADDLLYVTDIELVSQECRLVPFSVQEFRVLEKVAVRPTYWSRSDQDRLQ